MARYRRKDSLEMRLADDLRAGGRAFSADLIAKRATGVEGYRMTLAFLELDGEASFFVDLEPVPTREEAARRGEALAEDHGRLRSLLEEESAGAGSEA